MTRRLLLVRIALAGGLLVVVAPDAHACLCQAAGPATVRDRSDAVFAGRVLGFDPAVPDALGRLDERAVAGFAVDSVGTAGQQLERQPGKGLSTGGVTLPRALAELGLIDEYEFVVHPTFAGHGPTPFVGPS